MLLSPNMLLSQHAIASMFITVATPQHFLLTASYIAFLESLFLYFLFHRNLLVFLGLYLPVIVDPAPHNTHSSCTSACSRSLPCTLACRRSFPSTRSPWTLDCSILFPCTSA